MMYYLAGAWTKSSRTRKVLNPYNDHVVAEIYEADASTFGEAIDRAHAVRAEVAGQPVFERVRILQTVADGIEKAALDFAKMITWESGRSLKDTRAEVSRACFTFRVAAEEARRIGGEVVDLDWLPGMEKRYGLTRRFPIGVVGAITPFNFPLNLVAHKIAPAIACGCPVILKPASKTPIVALMLARLLDDAAVVRGSISVLPAPADETGMLIEDERVKLLTFTGSPEVGWAIKQRAGRKRVALELGGNAGCVVCRDADLNWSVRRVCEGSFAQAGQSCISVQRVFVHESLYDRFTSDLVASTRRLKVGDPSDILTDVGPVVDDRAVSRISEWLKAAVDAGARVLTGGQHSDRLFEPTVLTDVPEHLNVCTEELFAPVVVIQSYHEYESAIAQLNDTRFGLQAGVFTFDLRRIDHAFKSLDVGAVIINDVPTFRTDQMPYGGQKESGIGREGPRYAIAEMTEEKLLVINLDSSSTLLPDSRNT